MSEPHDEDLVAKFFNDELSDEEQLRLADLLGSSPNAQKRFALHMQTESELLRVAAKRKLAANQHRVAIEDKHDVHQNRPHRTPGLWPSSLWVGGASTVAVVVFLLFFMIQRSDSQLSAAELFRQLEQVSHQRFDRIYAIERFVRRGETISRVEGELRCRGTELFVVEFPGVVVGGSGDGQFWFVPKSGLAFKVNSLSEIADGHARLELGWLEALLSDSDSEMALSAAKVLSLIRIHGYEITREQFNSANNESKDEVLICRLPNQNRLPHTIRIHAEKSTQEIVSLDLDWGAGQRPNAADLLSIKLKSVGNLPAEEFQMENYLESSSQ